MRHLTRTILIVLLMTNIPLLRASARAGLVLLTETNGGTPTPVLVMPSCLRAIRETNPGAGCQLTTQSNRKIDVEETPIEVLARFASVRGVRPHPWDRADLLE